MDIKLGIDTGGSYTDAVMISCDTQKIIREAKTPTTRQNLAVGVEKAIDALHISGTEHVTLVCLSTTLATNAVVEGKSSAVGLITIGAPAGRRDYPAVCCAGIRGKISVAGCEVELLDRAAAETALRQMRGRVEALAVSGYASVRNPIHELEVKALAENLLGVPVVCGHELTSTLGYYERTVTAVLNARLIPVIRELLTATRTALAGRGIDARLLVVKGNGHVMVDSFAESRPVETILSGPAASMVGGRFLSGCTDALIADMGGTTTDVVAVAGGKAALEKEGAVVGGWLTRVSAVQVNTFGLGGDSYIRISPFGTLSFGPDRVEPLCAAAAENPRLCDEIAECRNDGPYRVVKRQETDCFRLLKTENLDKFELSDLDRRIIDLLDGGPRSLLWMSRELGRDLDSMGMQRLMDLEIVSCISMTPTDLLHAKGEYDRWNAEASRLGARLLSGRLNMSVEAFLAAATEQFVYKLCTALIQSVCRADGVKADLEKDPGAMALIDNVLGRSKKSRLELDLKLRIPIVGIGAPAAAWFSKAARLLGAQLIIPEHNAVGGAAGAAMGQVREVFTALIRFDPQSDRFAAHTPRSRMLFKTLEEAKGYCRKEMTVCARTLARELEIEDERISITENDCHSRNKENRTGGFVESRLTAVLTGAPRRAVR
ncbi:hydantoinase/oxoprolinase family protein [Bacilliculturomica massiliensis]|uniref:hydantoinase/oxoprolinase family protein n=1 Tax=Bacilliculturomica massiliensis TaxID=1917867 RepID=UPI001032334B|nr:hydantoinase/oxoprolinase family protein [Bacilliculturomica massiliensis]